MVHCLRLVYKEEIIAISVSLRLVLQATRLPADEIHIIIRWTNGLWRRFQSPDLQSD